MGLICTATFLLFFSGATTANLSPPEVSTSLGRVQGQWKTSYDGRQYAAFEGIPYAKPPIGELRFEEPQPVEPWPGTWNATQSYRCIQTPLGLSNNIEGHEDCLYINVFVPTVGQTELDVVVHIHGGGFTSGSGLDYLDPKYVLDRDFVFVTFNYRLGVLGFVSTDDEVLPGNNGMKDQVLALKWVQQNIRSFGGNPDSVTLTGFSAGSASVHLHYFSPLSKGLFHRGMSMSGTAANSWAVTEQIVENTKKLTSLVGCPVSDSKTLVECLRTRPAAALLGKLEYVYPFPPGPSTIFCPVVDKHSKSPFLPKHPHTLLKEKKVLDVPWITSVTRDDGLIIAPMFLHKLQIMNEKWEEVAPYVLHREELHNKKGVSRDIKNFYIGEGGEFSLDNLTPYIKMLTDSLFVIDAESVAKLQSEITKSPVYFYLFNYEKGRNNFLDLIVPNHKFTGVSHGDDMIYLFGGPIKYALSESDIKLKNACLDMLYSYAKYGVPSFKGVDWRPTGDDELTFLNITGPDDIKLQSTSDLSSAAKAWKNVGLLENVKDEL